MMQIDDEGVPAIVDLVTTPDIEVESGVLKGDSQTVVTQGEDGVAANQVAGAEIGTSSVIAFVVVMVVVGGCLVGAGMFFAWRRNERGRDAREVAEMRLLKRSGLSPSCQRAMQELVHATFVRENLRDSLGENLRSVPQAGSVSMLGMLMAPHAAADAARAIATPGGSAKLGVTVDVKPLAKAMERLGSPIDDVLKMGTGKKKLGLREAAVKGLESVMPGARAKAVAAPAKLRR